MAEPAPKRIVALLNHTTNTSVLAPLTGLSQTDALLNIQSNGQTYTSNAVTLGGASGSGWVSGAEPNPRTVQIDVSTLTPGTVVTLYFDLLGFGAKDSSVTIDDVQILSELSQAPIARSGRGAGGFGVSAQRSTERSRRSPNAEGHICARGLIYS